MATFNTRGASTASFNDSPNQPAAQYAAAVTSAEWIAAVQAVGSRASHGTRARPANVMVECLWRSAEYEDIYLRDYGDPAEVRRARGGISGSTTTNDHPEGLRIACRWRNER